MYTDYEALKMHKIRERELLQDAHERRLAAIVSNHKESLNERLRAILASINAKLYLSPANKGLDCVLLPSTC